MAIYVSCADENLKFFYNNIQTQKRRGLYKIMYIIGICDEDLEYINYSRNILETFFLSNKTSVTVYEFYKKQDLVDYYRDGGQYIDFLFLNTIMQKDSTISLAKQIKKIDGNCQIVFWTSEIDSSRCYEVEHSYLLKQNMLEVSLEHMVGCLMKKYEQIKENETKQRLIVQIRGETIFLMQNEIQYLERSERKTYIYSCNHGQERVVATAQKINELGEILNPHIFMRCHNSYIVNINYISKMYREHFVLKNGKSIPISRRYSKRIRERF